MRVILKHPQAGDDETIIKYMTPKELESDTAFIDPETKEELDLVDQEAFVDWISENYKGFGAELAFITDRSPEGSQFVKGFGGIGGGLLVYRLLGKHLDGAAGPRRAFRVS